MRDKIKSGIWTEEYKIHSFDVDYKGEVSIHQLLRFFQETAYYHAEDLGVGYSFLRGKEMMWVLSSISLEVDRYPKWGDVIHIHTWPSGKDKLVYYRDFKITDTGGAFLGKAVSKWFVIDMKRRRPQRTDSMSEFNFEYLDSQFIKRPGRIEAQSDLPTMREITVDYIDLDLNRHVNNAKYIEWVLGAYPMDFIDSHFLKSMEASYTSEVQYGDRVLIKSVEISGGERIHLLVRTTDGKEVCRIGFCWE